MGAADVGHASVDIGHASVDIGHASNAMSALSVANLPIYQVYQNPMRVRTASGPLNI